MSCTLTENVCSPSPVITFSSMETTSCRVGMPGGGDLHREEVEGDEIKEVLVEYPPTSRLHSGDLL